MNVNYPVIAASRCYVGSPLEFEPLFWSGTVSLRSRFELAGQPSCWRSASSSWLLSYPELSIGNTRYQYDFQHS